MRKLRMALDMRCADEDSWILIIVSLRKMKPWSDFPLVSHIKCLVLIEITIIYTENIGQDINKTMELDDRIE